MTGGGQHSQLLIIVYNRLQLVRLHLRQISRFEHTLHHHDGLVPALSTQLQRAVEFYQGQAIGFGKSTQGCHQPMTVGISFHDSPDLTIWHSAASHAQVGLHGGDVSGGNKWSRHACILPELAC